MRIESGLWKIFLATLLVSLTSCNGTLPPPPQAQLCSHNLIQGYWVCISIADAVKQVKNPKMLFVLDKETNNWVGTDPKSWGEIQGYIGKLKVLAEKKCN